MQFPVPQFTDVEDRVIGSLTIKQFGILFGAGVVIFLAYSASKSIPVAIAFILLLGVPALGIAFAKINGRPIYNTFGLFAKFILSPKVLIFHKEASGLSDSSRIKNAEVAAPASGPALGDTQTRLRDVNILLQKKAKEEQDILKQIR